MAPASPSSTRSVESAPRSIAPGREQDLSKVDTTDPDFHQQSLVGMGSETHGGEDVALFARGPGADLARGAIDQNEIYHIMRRALRWKSP